MFALVYVYPVISRIRFWYPIVLITCNSLHIHGDDMIMYRPLRYYLCQQGGGYVIISKDNWRTRRRRPNLAGMDKGWPSRSD